MKVYRLYVGMPIIVCYLLAALAWPLIGVSGIIAASCGLFGPDKSAAWLFVIELAIGFFIAYSWLRFPFEIRLSGGTIEFRSIFRKTIIPATEIKSVRAKRYAIGFVDVRHDRGTVHLIHQMDGFYDFVCTVKSLNPAVKIEGC